MDYAMTQAHPRVHLIKFMILLPSISFYITLCHFLFCLLEGITPLPSMLLMYNFYISYWDTSNNALRAMQFGISLLVPAAWHGIRQLYTSETLVCTVYGGSLFENFFLLRVIYFGFQVILKFFVFQITISSAFLFHATYIQALR